MVQLNLKREWGNSGLHIEEPDTADQDKGYEGGEKPFGEHHNWIFNSSDRQSNDLIHRSNLRENHSGGTLTRQLIEFGYQEWMHPYAPINTVNLANPALDMCRGYNYELRHASTFVVVDGYAGIVEVYNGDDSLIKTIDRPLVLDNGAEEIEAIVSDGTYLYAMTTGKPGFQATIYQFNCNPWSTTKNWSYDSVQAFNQSGQGQNDIIFANPDWLAMPCTDQELGSGPMIFMLKTDGVSTRQGSGNAPALTGYEPAHFLVSNQTNLFFVLEDVGNQVPRFCTADIADPTQGTGPGGALPTWITAGSGNISAGQLIFDGWLIHFALSNGRIYSYDWTNDHQHIESHASWGVTDVPAPLSIDAPPLVFDGLRAWTLSKYQGDAGDNSGFIVPINVAEEGLDDALTKNVSGPRIMVTSPFPDTPAITKAKMIFSDNTLWFSINTSSNVLYRVPNILGRP
jgi:hypothetical protein